MGKFPMNPYDLWRIYEAITTHYRFRPIFFRNSLWTNGQVRYRRILLKGQLIAVIGGTICH